MILSVFYLLGLTLGLENQAQAGNTHAPSPIENWIKIECKDGPRSTLQILYDPNGSRQARFQFQEQKIKSPFMKGLYEPSEMDRRLIIRSDNPIPNGRFDLQIRTTETPMRASLKVDGYFLKSWHTERATEDRPEFQWSVCEQVSAFSEKIIEDFNLETVSKLRGKFTLRKVGSGTANEYDVMILDTEREGKKEQVLIQLNGIHFEVIKAARALANLNVEVIGEQKDDRIIVSQTSDISVVLSLGQSSQTISGTLGLEGLKVILKLDDGTRKELAALGEASLSVVSPNFLSGFAELRVEIQGHEEGSHFFVNRIRFAPSCDSQIGAKK
jgi:hypothetical protein